jgi:hypothetical protein
MASNPVNGASNAGGASSSNPTVTLPTASVTVRRKNAPGNQSDPAWQYAISIDLKLRRVQCKFCNLPFTGLYELGNIWNDMIMKYQLIKFILFMYYIFLCVCMYMYM